MLDPAQNRGVRLRDASVRHHDDQISEAQFEPRVPADTQDDDLSVEMPSLEQCFDWNKLLHSAIIARSHPVCTRTELWRLDESTIRRMFQDEPGVLKIGKSNRRDGKRDYVTLRIPEDIARRVYVDRTR